MGQIDYNSKFTGAELDGRLERVNELAAELDAAQKDFTQQITTTRDELQQQAATNKAELEQVVGDYKTETDSKLTELESVLGNAFTKKGYAYSADNKIFYENKGTDATPYLRAGKKVSGKMFLGGPNYPLYGVIFFTADFNIISRYVGNSSNGRLEEFSVDCPEGAAYFVATNLNQYRDESYILIDAYLYAQDVVDISGKFPQVETTVGDKIRNTASISEGARFSKGIKCNSGKVAITIAVTQGEPTTGWSAYRYTNGSFSETTIITKQEYGKRVILDVPEGDDGVWLYIPNNATAYTIDYTVSSAMVLDVELLSDASQLLDDKVDSIEERIKDVDYIPDIKQQLEELTGDLGAENLKSTKTRIGIWLDNAPARDFYKVRVLCDNPPVDNFNIYSATTGHAELSVLERKVKFGTWVTIERDSSKPVLYIYNTEAAEVAIDVRNYTVEYIALNSLVQDVEDLKNKESGVASWVGKTVVCFGDSLTEFKDYDNSKTYADYIHELTEAEVFNIGVGGTQFRQRTTPVASPTTSNEAYAALDIVNMVRASCEQDFQKQIAATNYLTQNNIDSNDAIIARMQTIDWSKVDVVTIFAGTNDWNNASSSWGVESSSDVNYTFGAMNEIVRMLLTSYPHVHIYWFTPVVRWLTDDNGDRIEATFSDNLKKNDTTLKEFSAKIEEVVKKHHLPICDMYNTLGWNVYNFSQFFSDTDGTHPRKGKGTEQIAKKIVAFINANKTF